MKKMLVFGLIAAGAAAAAAVIYKARKSADYICEDDCCDDDCFCDDCCEDCCDDICEIPAESADESCVSADSADEKPAEDDETPMGI